jgi:hypothetical protein
VINQDESTNTQILLLNVKSLTLIKNIQRSEVFFFVGVSTIKSRTHSTSLSTCKLAATANVASTFSSTTSFGSQCAYKSVVCMLICSNSTIFIVFDLSHTQVKMAMATNRASYRRGVRRLGWTCVFLLFSSATLSRVFLIKVDDQFSSDRNQVDSSNHNYGFPNNILFATGSSSLAFLNFAEAVNVSEDSDDDGKDNDDGNNKQTTRRASEVKDERSIFTAPDFLAVPAVPSNVRQIMHKAWLKALGGGIPGAIAGGVQVLFLMWLRTVINYQSRYGTSFSRALSILYKEGGIRRFYRGLGFALFQAPFSRFVATAANDGVYSLLSNLPATKLWGASSKTFFASFVVGVTRVAMMPVDTAKTVLQVDSIQGFQNLMKRVKEGDFGALYQGAWATALSSSLGHYPC